MIKSNLVVKSYTVTIGRDNWGRCKDQWREQQLIKQYFLCGILVWQREIDKEIVPNHVWISFCTLGFDSSNWRSKFAQYIKK